jgi:hypothetical protein
MDGSAVAEPFVYFEGVFDERRPLTAAMVRQTPAETRKQTLIHHPSDCDCHALRRLKTAITARTPPKIHRTSLRGRGTVPFMS